MLSLSLFDRFFAVETITSGRVAHPYDESTREFLDAIDAGLLSADLLDLLDDLSVPASFFEGQIVVELRDFRGQAIPPSFWTPSAGSSAPSSAPARQAPAPEPKLVRVLLRPTADTVVSDVYRIYRRSQRLWWSHDDFLALERRMLLHTSGPLCLAPTPRVARLLNRAHFCQRMWLRPVATSGVADEQKQVTQVHAWAQHVAGLLPSLGSLSALGVLGSLSALGSLDPAAAAAAAAAGGRGGMPPAAPPPPPPLPPPPPPSTPPSRLYDFIARQRSRCPPRRPNYLDPASSTNFAVFAHQAANRLVAQLTGTFRPPLPLPALALGTEQPVARAAAANPRPPQFAALCNRVIRFSGSRQPRHSVTAHMPRPEPFFCTVAISEKVSSPGQFVMSMRIGSGQDTGTNGVLSRVSLGSASEAEQFLHQLCVLFEKEGHYHYSDSYQPPFRTARPLS